MATGRIRQREATEGTGAFGPKPGLEAFRAGGMATWHDAEGRIIDWFAFRLELTFRFAANLAHQPLRLIDEKRDLGKREEAFVWVVVSVRLRPR